MTTQPKKIPTEHQEQREFVKWFRQNITKETGVRIFAIPNGGYRGAATAGKLKAEGVTAGVPDLFIPEWLVWVEMKRIKGGMVSEEQKDWEFYLSETCGHTWMECRGADQAKEFINYFRKNRISC